MIRSLVFSLLIVGTMSAQQCPSNQYWDGGYVSGTTHFPGHCADYTVPFVGNPLGLNKVSRLPPLSWIGKHSCTMTEALMTGFHIYYSDNVRLPDIMMCDPLNGGKVGFKTRDELMGIMRTVEPSASPMHDAVYRQDTGMGRCPMDQHFHDHGIRWEDTSFVGDGYCHRNSDDSRVVVLPVK